MSKNVTTDDSATPENALFIGIDLGTSRSAISAANGLRKNVESYVGWPKDAVSLKHLGGRDIIFGKDALDNRLSLDLYRPLGVGVIQEDKDGTRNLEAAKELINYLVEMVEPARGEQVYGVVGVPSEASGKNKEDIIEVTKGIFDAVMICTEPFCVAYGLDRTSDVLVVDIGAGTGDAVDTKMMELFKKKYPNASVSMNMIKRFKEQYGFVHSGTDKIEVEMPVNGKPTMHDVTDEIRSACSILIDPIVEGIHKLIATFDPEFQDRLRDNIILAGGGGLMRGLNKAIEDKLERVGGAKVTVVEEPLYSGSNGGLKLAMDMPMDYWQQLK